MMKRNNVKKAVKRIHKEVETHEKTKKDSNFRAAGFLVGVTRHMRRAEESDLSHRHDFYLYGEGGSVF